MLFNQTVLTQKMKYIDTTPMALVEAIAQKVFGDVNFTVSRKERVWFPGGGADLFLATSANQTIFIKAKHKSLLIESKLESEPEFSSLSALENELAFFTELAPSPHVPKVLAHMVCNGYMLLAVESLEPFSALATMNPEEQVAAYEALELFVQELYEKGIVHTDIHEHNVCFRGTTPVLLDFEEAKRLHQNVPFALSLDVVGSVGADDVGEFPVLDEGAIPGLTCLKRLKKVFCKMLERQLPAYLSQCNFDNTSTYNLDTEQQQDERIYQSIILPGIELKGQRPVADRRLSIVKNTIEHVAQGLGRPVHVVDLGSNMGMVSFACASSANVATVQGLEADPRYVSASKVLSFYCDRQDNVHFTEYMTGLVPYKWKTDILLLLSVYHHVPDKNAFLQEVLAQNPVCVLGEFATQERYYAERTSLEHELVHIKQTLGFSCMEVLAISEDYQRPIVVFHNGVPGVMSTCNTSACSTPSTQKAPTRPHAPLSLTRSPSIQKALTWLIKNSLKQPLGLGVTVSNKQQIPYPEVTGYCIPSLLDWGEADLAMQYAYWLASIQNPDGSFPGPNDNTPFAFDTGQVIRGLAAILPLLPEVESTLVRACDWIVKTASPKGQIILPANMEDWSLGKRGYVNEAIHLYVLPGIKQAGEALGTDRYNLFVQQSLDYYITNCNLTNFLAPNMLLHFYCYIQEALFDLGAIDICKAGMRELADRQKNSGMVPAYAGDSWICSPGLIQSGLVWYKLGDYQRADKVLRVVEGLQEHSGGFLGGIGTGADYFPDEELSWAVKFYLDATKLRIAMAEKERNSEFSYKARAEAVANLPVASTTTPKETPPQPVEIKTAEPQPQCALIPLQQFAIRTVEKNACSLLHNASAKGNLSFQEGASLALAVPTLLTWGRKKLALQCASMVHSGMEKAINSPLHVLQPDDWLTFAHSLRALRQPEVLQQQGNKFLQQLCAYVIAKRPPAGEAALSFLAALYEVHQCSLLLEGTSLDTTLISQANGYWTPKAQPVPQASFWQIRAVAEFITRDVAVRLLQSTIKDNLFSHELTISWDSVISVGSLTLAAQEVRDSATAENLFHTTANMLEILHSTNAESGDSHTGLAAASVFLDSLSTKLDGSFAKAFPSFHDSIEPTDGRLTFVMQHLPHSSDAKILDLGCAKGRYLYHISQNGKKYSLYAEDVHPDFISHIPAGITTSIGSMLRSSHDDASLDTVLLCEVLEHCVDLQAAIGELYRILKENGRVIIIDKDIRALSSWQGELPSWEQWFDLQELSIAFKNQGFAIIRCEENLMYEDNRRDGVFFGLVVEKTPVKLAQAGHLEELPSSTPLVSIVLPTFNHLSYLPLAIDSIFAQSYGNFELIVVDDGSEDGTGVYLDTLTSPKIRVLKGPNTRLPTALNRGFAEARGDLLTWTSADNICLPEFLHALVGALNTYPQAGFAYGPFDYIDASGHVYDKISEQDLSLHASIASNTGVASFLYRRSVAEQAGQYDPRVEGAEDWDMWLRMLEITTPVYVDARIYQYRQHLQSMTATIPEKVRTASERVAIRNFERIEKNGGITAFFPQIAHCADKEKALFYANRELGSRMLHPHSFLKKYAVRYLQAAYAMNPQDICTIANYAIALECCGQHTEALGILESAARLPTAVQLETCRQFVTRSRGRIKDLHGATVPVFVDNAKKPSELMQKVQAERLVFTP